MEVDMLAVAKEAATPTTRLSVARTQVVRELALLANKLQGKARDIVLDLLIEVTNP